MSKPSIIAITNNKGGVGKTISSVNLAASFCDLGKKTLLIDFDGQANTTRWFGLRARVKDDGRSVSKGLLDESLNVEDLIYHTQQKNLDILASDMSLTDFAREQITIPNSGMLLEELLDRSTLDHEIIIIDCAPALDLLFQNALNASHYYLIPLKSEIDPLEGCENLFKEMIRIKKYNKQLYFLGFLITDYCKAVKTHQILKGEIEKYASKIDHKVVGIIPRTAGASSSALENKPFLWVHNRSFKGTEEYLKVASDLIPNLRGPRRGKAQPTPQSENVPFIKPQLIESSIQS
ncbi:MAG: ParA family protein [Oligoflexales bacterium]